MGVWAFLVYLVGKILWRYLGGSVGNEAGCLGV